MANNKKHHYVPRFYLKRFSPDGKSVNLWNLSSKKKIIAANLKGQCYKNYLYGKEQDVEFALGKIEGQASQIFSLMDKYNCTPSYGTEDCLVLLVYVIMQYGRTLYSADTLNEMNDQVMKYLLGPKAEADGIDLSRVTIGLKNPAQYSLSLLSQSLPLVMDLNCKLLINESNVEFVTSDNPVVFYNQLFSFRKFGCATGLASKGLQIFFPISPTKALLFFDQRVYGVGKQKNTFVIISNPRDVFEINNLQMCSAAENVYFHDKDLNVDALYRKAASFRRIKKANMDIFPGKETVDRKHEYVATSREDIRCDLALSFVRLTRQAKSWRDKFRKQKFQAAVVVRDERLCDDHREFWDKVDRQEYKNANFFRYLSEKHEIS